MKIQDMPLNANTAKTIARRVMKDRNMRITDKFSPVISEHKLLIGDKKRITLLLTEDEFVHREENFIRGQWKQVVKIISKGSREELENEFISAVNYIVELGERFKKYRIIK